ncbi:MAG: hypothetical protein E6R03_09785 [Hyphomicrobiaceae bacterium]|nr:MAG: hypothetical protein E6R03_09785 [Hyphomicrobiaceae bacterium]
MYKSKESISAIQWLGFLAVLAGMMCFGTGCAGLELGGRLGVYRVDERREEQRTYRNPKPAICYLLPSRCAPQQPEADEANGS